ncbi:hypothetical protein PVAND_017688, partial [Polypedilum vanderplanki]
ISRKRQERPSLDNSEVQNLNIEVKKSKMDGDNMKELFEQIKSTNELIKANGERFEKFAIETNNRSLSLDQKLSDLDSLND